MVLVGAETFGKPVRVDRNAAAEIHDLDVGAKLFGDFGPAKAKGAGGKRQDFIAP